MKRFLSFVLITVMMLGVLVGCETTPKQVEEHTFPDAEYAVNATDMAVVGDKIYYISEAMTPDENSVAYNIYRYLSNNGDYWCAVVCDEEGKILYTFYSKKEITEDELVPMSAEQQRDIETNLFTRGEVVGWYAPS